MAKNVKPKLQQKLSGFVRLVLSIPSDSPKIPINSICHITGDPPNAQLLSQNGVVLCDIFRHDVNANNSNNSSSSKKKWSKIGMVHGSISVLQQLQVLVSSKCLSIVARFVGEEERGGEVRGVVFVDVYLPVSVWLCEWQFPRSKAVAAALFKHLSCDWEARSSMLELLKLDSQDNSNVWNVTDCHVLGCKHHCSSPDNPKKKLFDLQEIFKSLPCTTKKTDHDGLRVNPAYLTNDTGISDLSDDILITILVALRPIDLLNISLTCHHMRFLASSIMPCMKLKLYPHQQAAVDWMLRRERECKVLQHPLYMDFKTEDGFDYSISVVSGEIVTGVAPTLKDFHGGLFCDEPGLGKTITSLSLILKTQGTLPEIPNGVSVNWCIHDGNRKCGYYEANKDDMKKGMLTCEENMGRKPKRGKLSLDEVTPKKIPISSTSDLHRPICPGEQILDSWSKKRIKISDSPRTLEKKNREKNSEERVYSTRRRSISKNKEKEVIEENLVYNETWVQCDSCSKWRRLADGNAASALTAWFCVMNDDPLHQSCNVPEESWDNKAPIMYLPGFRAKGSCGSNEENISFFVGVLKEHRKLIRTETNNALTWLAKLSPTELAEMETFGLASPAVGKSLFDSRVPRDYHKIFRAFGLTKREEKNVLRWYYPKKLVNLEFDLDSLRIAICEPLDSLRLYISSATLIVVPANLVDHWKTQIEKHVTPGQLKVYVWGDQKKKPPPQDLAWDYDVVITTFTRLSAEWGPHKKSVLMQVHWLRIMLDEGHTLGLSVSLTNKLQMAVSLIATSRWLLTGTPTPNTPSSQLSSLQPMLKFLQEEAYGLDQKSWDSGVLRPFEAKIEEGRSRLLQLLQRSMISARKIDLQAIPPCIKKVTFVDFSEQHAKTYNELVETVCRNILLADWNDPSHVESLLNPKQWKSRSTTIRNVRLSCCVAGNVNVSDAGDDIQETMDILVDKGLDSFSDEYISIKIDLADGRSCMRCNQWCRLPVITPCRHLLCLQCVALDSEKCALSGCGNKYEMQNPETLARPENPNPKWPVPKDLIELQPSYKQDDWNPDWKSTSSSKVTYLVDRLKKLQETNRMMIDDSISKGDDGMSDDRISAYGRLSNTFIDAKTYNDRNNGWNQSSPEKVIIFSQFLEHILVIEEQLTTAGIEFAGMYCPMNSVSKMKSLATFQHDPNCMVLVMDGSAALGLDLSFVNHVYLMEPIWDRSMEEQVISRAHRMGAVRPIHVETLAMKGTIEEQMVKFLQDVDGCRTLLNGDVNTKDLDGTRSHRTLHDFAENNYLSRLSFVRTKS